MDTPRKIKNKKSEDSSKENENDTYNDNDNDDKEPIIKKKKRSRKTPSLRETLGHEEWLRFKNFKKEMNKYICTTRFTNFTWQENQNYVINQNKNKCIYGSPFALKARIPPDGIVFVLEMNNDENKIMGIGLIRNHPICRKHNIHENGNYNRYAFIGIYHIAREDMSPEEENIMKAFDILCFKGSKHMKRGSGINLFPDEILFRCLPIIDLVEFVSLMFKKRMKNTKTERK